jgi:hypothetical protein
MASELDKYLQETVDNIRNDREVTKELLDDAMKWLAKDESRHRELGLVLSKYVETLQRSNEQLVKVASLISKKASSQDLTDDDKEQIFDMIKGDEKDETSQS